MKLTFLILSVAFAVAQYQSPPSQDPSYPPAQPPVYNPPQWPLYPPFGHHHRSSSSSNSRRSSSSSSSSSEEEACHQCKKLGIYDGVTNIPYADPEVSYYQKNGCWRAIASCPFNGTEFVLVGLENKLPTVFEQHIIGWAKNLQRAVQCNGDKKWTAKDLLTRKQVSFKYITCVRAAIVFSGKENIANGVSATEKPIIAVETKATTEASTDVTTTTVSDETVETTSAAAESTTIADETTTVTEETTAATGESTTTVVEETTAATEESATTVAEEIEETTTAAETTTVAEETTTVAEESTAAAEESTTTVAEESTTVPEESSGETPANIS